MRCAIHVWLFWQLFAFLHAAAMWNKRGKPYDPAVFFSLDKTEERHRGFVSISNNIAGDVCEELIQAGIDAKTFKGRHKGIIKNNAHRDLLRRIVKGSWWPQLYWASVRVWDPKKQKATVCKMPFLLPHEVLHALARKKTADTQWQRDGLSEAAAKHLDFVMREAAVSNPVALGLWLDGTPCNWDRSKSVESICMNFAGQSGDSHNIRIPLSCVMKHHCLKHKTVDDMLKVVAWSMECALNGTFPSCRHNGKPFNKYDRTRAKMSSQPLGAHGIVVEVRADWACLKQTFRFPSWNEKQGCCFRCKVKPSGIKHFDSTAPWRKPENRHSHWSLMTKIATLGYGICPIFSIPFLRSEHFVIDWLHCVDLGVAQDYLGNLFWAALPKLEGKNREQRIAALFIKMQEFYKRTKVSSKLDDLKETMLRKKPTSAPKLRSKAAEARFLIPFAKELAQDIFSGENTMDQAIKESAILLNSCYEMLSKSKYSHELLADSCKRFCVLYGALEACTPDPFWKVKPKFHLFQELCELENTCPSTCWTYRDEDFGGSIATAARSRGGRQSQATTSFKVLTKFRARHDVPLL